jgi:serine/threonine-protein kinase
MGTWWLVKRPTYDALPPPLIELLPLTAQAGKLLEPYLLEQARELAAQSRLRDAIQLLSMVSLPEAQTLMTAWAEQILAIATNKYETGQFSEAVAIAQGIPESCPLAAQTQDVIQQWQQDWQRNQDRQKAAEAALDRDQWTEAIKTAETMGGTPYWRDQADALIQRAKAGQRAAQAAAQAPSPRQTQPSASSRTSSSRTSSPRPSQSKPSSRSRSSRGGSNWEVENR